MGINYLVVQGGAEPPLKGIVVIPPVISHLIPAESLKSMIWFPADSKGPKCTGAERDLQPPLERGGRRSDGLGFVLSGSLA